MLLISILIVFQIQLIGLNAFKLDRWSGRLQIQVSPFLLVKNLPNETNHLIFILQRKIFSMTADSEPPNKRKGSISGSSTSIPEDQVSRTKSKMGRPQRKLTYSKIDADAPGRVSVYCVGSEIDLNALRAHVFRRGFGSNQMKSSGDHSMPELTLTRKTGEDDLDDEVLHVSNVPLFFSSGESQIESLSNMLDHREEDKAWSRPNSAPPILVSMQV